jgi:hypothetical protein
VALVGGVTMAVVNVVGMTVVWNGDVAAVGTVLVVMALVDGVRGRGAFIDMIFVRAVDVIVVHVVHMVAMRDRDVAAALAVHVRMVGVCGVLSRRGHATWLLSRHWAIR